MYFVSPTMQICIMLFCCLDVEPGISGCHVCFWELRLLILHGDYAHYRLNFILFFKKYDIYFMCHMNSFLEKKI